MIITDSVCIKVISSDKLFVGTGNRLRYFFINQVNKTKELLVPLPQLNDKIHGIGFYKISDNKFRVVIHAGREIVSFILEHDIFSSILKCKEDDCKQLIMFGDRLALVDKNRSIDWISSILVYNSNSVAILTAHNVIMNMNICPEYVHVRHKVACEESSTLYCSKIVGSSWDSLLVFAGTALGDLVVWRPTQQQVLYRISGHNGVIFSIDINLDNDFLTTTSDDRSVKFWKFHIDNSENVTMEELKHSFGHTARVFKSKIIQNSEKNIIVSSIGEDSNLCLWNQDGSFLAKKFLGGSAIWDLDYDPKTETIFTSASNGEIRKFCLNKYFNENKDELIELENNLDENFSKIKMMENGTLIGITENNSIYFKNKIFQLIESNLSLKCSILAVDKNRLYIAGVGKLAIYEFTDHKFNLISVVNNLDFRPSKKVFIVRSLFFLDQNEAIICNNDGKCFIFDRDFVDLKHQFTLPKCRERWLTAVAKYEGFFLLADRCGHLFLYDSKTECPIYTLHRVHGTMGITNIILDAKNNNTTEKGIFFKTTGHDGTVKSVFLDTQKQSLNLHYTEKIPIVWIEKVLLINCREFFFGFNDNHFVCYERDEGILFEENCGGGHRFWDIWLSENEELHFYYIQRKKIMFKKLELMRKCENLIEIPQLNWHTMVCNVLKIQKLANNRFLMVSGGEDNDLKLNVFDHDINLISKRTIFSHISNIRTIFLKELDENQLLIVSAGGRAQICLTMFYKSNYQTKDLTNYMLKSTDEERKSQEIDFNPETRIMCSTIFDDDNRTTLVVGCSDGNIRVFEIDDHFCITLKRENNYGKCILNIHSMKIDHFNVILTMATDGYVCFWDSESLMNFMPYFYKITHHSSGINAFDIIKKHGNRFLIATGGDDQSISLSTVETNQSGHKLTVQLHETIQLGAYYHTAQVSGVRFLNEATLLTTGIDQKVFKLNLNCENVKRQPIVLNEYLSSIADVKGILDLNEDQFLVYGNGFEVFKFQL